MRAAWLRRSSSDRSASRRCSARSRMNPTMNAPTVPTAEKISAAVPTQALAKVRPVGCGKEVVHAHPHGAIHGEAGKLVPWNPPDLARLVAGRWFARKRHYEEYDRELLARFTIACVEDDVS